MRKLMLQQEKALNYAKPLARAALFMEMRLGKTTVAIRWAEFNKLNRVLILCPDAVKPSWISELQQEQIADEDIIDVKGDLIKRLELSSDPSKGNWFIITYQSVLYGPEILDLQWDGIILDESTKIRNPQADITKLLKKKKDNFGYRIVLSGLPDPESRLDYYEQMAFLYDSFMHCCTYWEFRRKFFRQLGFEWKCDKYIEDKIKDEVGRLAFVMTRKEAGIGSKKLKTVLKVKMNKEQEELLKQIDEGFEFKSQNEEDYGEDTKWVPVTYVWQGIVAGGFTPHGILISDAKYKEILKLLKGELQKEKVIIWFKHNWEIEYAVEFFSKNKINTIKFTGQDKSQVDYFTKGNAQIICAQAKCGQYGLDWSISSTAIYYSNWYDGEVRAQSEDRIIHPKKKEPLLYIDVVTENSIDEDVVEILKSKSLSSKKFMNELAKRRNLK